jgi:hypothetical protein
MKKLIIYFCCFVFAVNLITSCTKKEIVTETVTNTIQVRAVDTVLALNTRNWNAFTYQTLTLVDSGAATFQTTSEGIKIIGQASRYGLRLQTKTELGFHNKTLYFKWKGDGAGQFSGFVPQIKYDILSNDGSPQTQGVDLGIFTVNNTSGGSTLIQNNVWYYTRATPVSGTDNYLVTTSTGNYSNLGGSVISTRTIPIYTKSGYPAFRIGDPFAGTPASAILAEFKIASN